MTQGKGIKSRGKFIAVPWVLVVLALLLAGCLSAAPKPTPVNDVVVPETVAAEGTFAVHVAPPDGAARPLAKLIAAEVAGQLTARRIPAATGLVGDRRYRLSGVVHPNRGRADTEFVAVIEWRLVRQNGQTVGTYPQAVQASRLHWEYGDPGMIAELGSRAADQVATWLASDPDFTPEPVTREYVFWVAGVRGAPGDGNQALAQAIREALPAGGIPVTERAEAAAYVLVADVGTAPPVNGEQQLTIRWQVYEWSGRPIGVAHQENRVPAALIQRHWGVSAERAAAAAVPGIKDVLLRRGLPLAPVGAAR